MAADEPVKDMELYQEFNGLRKIANVTKYKSKFVERRYAFGEKDVPTDAHRWLKVSYGFDRSFILASRRLSTHPLFVSRTRI